MPRLFQIVKCGALVSLVPIVFILLMTSPNLSSSRDNIVSTATLTGNITAFTAKLRAGPWKDKIVEQGNKDQNQAMDIFNPFGQQANGNKSYTFSDYFDYEDITEDISNAGHSLAVIVPFCNAHAELRHFLPHMRTFLMAQNISHRFYIIEQVDTFRFNRASLVNVGFLEMQRDGSSDYFAMHDVDLLPLNRKLSYRFHGCAEGPLHLASPKLHPQYSKIDFIGAVLLMTNEQYLKVNGMSNKFWGWGREDEELRIRLRKADIKIFRPSGVDSTKENSFRHIHNENTRKRDKEIIGDQYKVRFQLDTVTGLNTTKYRVVQKKIDDIQGVPYTLIRVKLECNRQITPWCIAE